MSIYRFILITILNLTAMHSIAQDTINATNKATDTTQNKAIGAQLNRLQQLQVEHVADSLRKEALQIQISMLKSTDNLRKSELQKELAQLKGQDSLRAARQKQQVDSLRKVVKGFPAVFFNDTLFNVYTRQGSFSAHDRANAISQRIEKVSNDHLFSPDSLKIIEAEQTTDIQYGSTLIMSVAAIDALWMNTKPNQLAATYKSIIGKAIQNYQRETSWQTLLKEAGMALGVIAITLLLIYAISRLFSWSQQKIIAQKGKLIKGLRIKNYELLTADRSVSALLVADTLIKWFFILLVVYLALPILFGIFPWTKDYSVKLLSYFINPVKKILAAIWDYIPNLITIIVLVLVFRYIIRFLRFLKDEVERGVLRIPGFYTDWANPTFQIIRILVLAFMLIVIFPYMPGSESPIFKGVSVFVGVLFTFGSAGALGNVVAGLVLTYMRAFKIGDRVQIGDATGDIIEKSLLVTRIRTIKNEVISIPNSMVMNNHTVNYTIETANKGLIIYKTVTIGYDVPWRKVHEILIDAAKATPMIEAEPGPYVLQTSFDDFSVAYQINAYTKQASKQAVIYSELYKNLQDKFNEAGIELLSPSYHAVRDGNTSTIPPEHLPKDYTSPGFNLKK
ncbi:mechanosensitive ion channel family protein [Mucilaginibacter terrae]|uniref:Small-conductance mechanosensitive channel n=1 Tax=Mucilaginibacter terrae TaxID=1955052 RepID=A0ABU3GXA5_9SPHI|nr:mechanosensitive ion channel family protein [Mucilaginibacter terrae]MDT3404399.1 small-conductance mechanosensitive channel [Mucilaginibacter terrae]